MKSTVYILCTFLIVMAFCGNPTYAQPTSVSDLTEINGIDNDGANWWVSGRYNSNSWKLYKVDDDKSTILKSYNIGSQNVPGIVYQSGNIYVRINVCGGMSNKIYKIRTTDGIKSLSTYKTRCWVYDMAFLGSTLWQTRDDVNSNNYEVFSHSGSLFTNEFTLSGLIRQSITSDETNLYIGDYINGIIYKVDISGQILDTINVSTPDQPRCISYLSSENAIYSYTTTSVDGICSIIKIADFDDAGDEEIVLFFDIKPQSCPNPLNIKSNGVLPVAIPGTEEFDVSDIDVSTITLEGVDPLRWNFEDVSTPVTDGQEDCKCTTGGADGFDDLTLKFSTSEIVDAIGSVNDGEVVLLTLTGNLFDGTPFEGKDCVIAKAKTSKKLGKAVALQLPNEFELHQNSPNPFNPITTIKYNIPAGVSYNISLKVYDLRGVLVKILVDNVGNPGFHSVVWDGIDETGNRVSSGVYLYKLQAGEFTKSNKMMLIR